MDVRVGKEPKPITTGVILKFNKVFNVMFEWFSNDHERILSVWWENHDEDPLSCFGSLTASNVRRWLKYYQLVTVEVEKQPLAKPDGVRKNRTLRIVRPTKRGFQAYECGKILEVKAGYSEQSYRIGIGKPYTYWSEIERIAEVIWEKNRIARTRRDKWYPDLREYYLDNLLDKKEDEALKMIHAWAFAKAFSWNINHRKHRVKIFQPLPRGCVPLDLGEGQKRLFDFQRN